MSMVTRYTNCRVLRDDSLLDDDLWVADGHIINPKNYFWNSRKIPDRTFDCQGKIIVPGFIESQINGGFGVDFSSNVDSLKEGLASFRKEITQFGITGFCPTMITSPCEVYKKALPLLRKQRGNLVQGAAVLGAHVEGPFINKDKNGAHPTEFIQSQCLSSKDEIIDFFGSINNITIMTIAPELPKALEMIECLVKNNVICSIGHSTANIDEAEGGVNTGATFITHLFNAMQPFHHRDPGIVGILSSVKLNRKCYYGIIADGLHTHPAALRIAHRTNAPCAVLVTDAMAAMGLGDGSHCIGSQSVTVTGKKAVISGTETLAGSVATMNSCVENFMRNSGCTLVEAVNCATKHPAQLLKCVDLYGTLDFGTVADFVIIDTDVNVLATFIGGDCVYKSDNIVGFFD
ncbi:N-acetylglucosamine-6-phosphate deacetylase-like [Bolinopsis microptera]|uniref:N-acetylglucosamine-6-phosphate deacetylase-like n=1 Tax=Bolinopsis microptera TaxID=2820187 RepID=UPI003078B5B0